LTDRGSSIVAVDGSRGGEHLLHLGVEVIHREALGIHFPAGGKGPVSMPDVPVGVAAKRVEDRRDESLVGVGPAW
jgi:hypothetical protein